MKETSNSLEYHYEIGIKFDYFVISIDIALLGWTIVNLDWLPKTDFYRWYIGIFWLLLILSIICGIIRQLYNSMIFSLNYHYLHEAELADVIEKASVQGGSFTDQATGKVCSSEEFKEFAKPHRLEEIRGRKNYDKYSKVGVIFANLTTIFLVFALVLLALIRISLL